MSDLPIADRRTARAVPNLSAAAVRREFDDQPLRRVAGRVLEVIAVYALLVAIAILFLLPLFWMVSTAFKPRELVYRFPPDWFESDFTLANFRAAWESLPFGRFFLNSLFITGCTVIGNVISSSLAGFGFARYRGRGSTLLFVVLLATMMVPPATTLIPRYVMFAKIGWIDSYLPLIAPAFLGSPFFVFLFRQFFRSIPRDYFDAAEIDGCSAFELYWRVAVPMARPAVVVTAMFAAIGAWNDVLDPLVFLNTLDKFTLQLGLVSFQSVYYNDLHLMMPMALVTMMPVLVLVAVGQRWITRGFVHEVEK